MFSWVCVRVCVGSGGKLQKKIFEEARTKDPVIKNRLQLLLCHRRPFTLSMRILRHGAEWCNHSWRDTAEKRGGKRRERIDN